MIRRAINVYEELQKQREQLHLPPADMSVSCQVAKSFASQFGVSAQAMQFRLSELGFIKLKDDLQMELF